MDNPPLAPQTAPGFAPGLVADLGVNSLTLMPAWVRAARAQSAEDMVFLSGAALSHLHLVTGFDRLPQALWRERLALGAAVACAGFAGRHASEAALRDAVHLTRPGDHPGPVGEIFGQWNQAVRRQAVRRKGTGITPALVNPVARAACVLEAMLAEAPRGETAALIAADAALARAMGWDHLVPLMAVGLGLRDLRKTGEDLRLACHRAVLTAAVAAAVLAQDLVLRGARLQTAARGLRGKRAAGAVALFMTRDALPATALTGLMSDRAARRLCDRLVAVGGLRELTGRGSFRLYGV